MGRIFGTFARHEFWLLFSRWRRLFVLFVENARQQWHFTIRFEAQWSTFVLRWTRFLMYLSSSSVVVTGVVVLLLPSGAAELRLLFVVRRPPLMMSRHLPPPPSLRLSSQLDRHSVTSGFSERYPIWNVIGTDFGGVVQWLGRWSSTGGLSWPVPDPWLTGVYHSCLCPLWVVPTTL